MICVGIRVSPEAESHRDLRPAGGDGLQRTGGGPRCDAADRLPARGHLHRRHPHPQRHHPQAPCGGAVSSVTEKFFWRCKKYYVFFKGDKVRIIDSNRNSVNETWYKIEFDNPTFGLIVGWVRSDFIYIK